MFTQEDFLKNIKTSKEMDSNCPIHKTLELLSGKWRTHVIFELCRCCDIT